MRVSSNTVPELVLDQLGKLTQKQAKLQNQISTGQHIQKASDNPNGFVKILNFQTEGRSLAQFQDNLDLYREASTTSFTVVESIKKLVNRSQEIATLADGLKSTEELQIYAVEVNEILNQAFRLANSESRNKFIFGGTQTSNEPFGATKNADNKITAVNYNGNTNPTEIAVSDRLRTNAYIIGENESGDGPIGLFKDSRNGTDIFNSLIQLRDQLEIGDSESISSVSMKNLEKEEEGILFHMGSIGATQAHMESIRSLLIERSESLNTLSSNEADVDITETVLLLNQAKVSYQAALQSAGQILNTSLLDYIR